MAAVNNSFEIGLIYHFPCVDGGFAAAAAAAALCPEFLSLPTRKPTPSTSSSGEAGEQQGTAAATTTTTTAVTSSPSKYKDRTVGGGTSEPAKNESKESAFGKVRFLPLTVYAKDDELDIVLQKAENLEIYMLDYTGPVGFLSKLALVAKKITILDHHKSGLEQVEDLKKNDLLPSNVEPNFDMLRSGATISLDYFSEHHGLALNDDQKLLFKYIEDHDLWRNALENSQAFHKGLMKRGIDLDGSYNPHFVVQLFALKANELIEEGIREIEDDNQKIAMEISQSFRVKLPKPLKITCLAVQSKVPHLRSEVGNALALKSKGEGLADVGIVSYRESVMEKGLIKLSFRSLGTDTTKMTQANGGGGHAKASSCIIDEKLWKSWIQK